MERDAQNPYTYNPDLENLYRQCQGSLTDFYQGFQLQAMNKKDEEEFQNLSQLDTISKNIQKLSTRLVHLEDKIESVSKSLVKCDKSKYKSGDYSDRELHPVQKRKSKNTRSRAGNGVTHGTPCIIPETTASIGPFCSRSPEKKTDGNSKPETNSRKSEKAVRGSTGHHQREHIIPVEFEGSVHSQNPHRRPSQAQNNGTNSYEKVYKLIPELLSKFEEFHQSFSEACETGQQIEPATAADILKVMDGHLKLLESLEMRLTKAL